MKKLTMVWRCGNVKEDILSTLFMLIDTQYVTQTMTGLQILNGIKSKQIEVTNMDVIDRGLVSINGALKNYTLLSKDGQILVGPTAVILDRIEKEGKLVGYTIFNENGAVELIDVKRAVELATKDKIANGKIRQTQSGPIISSITGSYQIREVAINKKIEKADLDIGLLFCGNAMFKNDDIKYAGVSIECTDGLYLSQIYKYIVKRNEDLIKFIEERSSINESKSLGIQRTMNGFYGVFPYEVINKLIELANKKISFMAGDLLIASTDYTNNKVESLVKLNKNKNITDSSFKSDRTKAQVENYSKAVLKMLADVKIV